MEIAMMFVTTETNEIRDLCADEIDAVSGAFKITLGGVTFHASAASMGLGVSIEGEGGIAVSPGGISVKDKDGNLRESTWGEILGGGGK
jgi:hypothetical protein